MFLPVPVKEGELECGLLGCGHRGGNSLALGEEVTVGNARRMKLISQNDSKDDRLVLARAAAPASKSPFASVMAPPLDARVASRADRAGERASSCVMVSKPEASVSGH